MYLLSPALRRYPPPRLRSFRRRPTRQAVELPAVRAPSATHMAPARACGRWRRTRRRCAAQQSFPLAGPDRSASVGGQPLRFSSRNTCAVSRRSRCWCRPPGRRSRPRAGCRPGTTAWCAGSAAEEPGRGEKAILAIARTLLKIAYEVLPSGEPYEDLGADLYSRRESPEQRRPAAAAGRAQPRLRVGCRGPEERRVDNPPGRSP